MTPQGKLSLCPTPLGNLEDITLRVLRVLRACDVIFAEDTRVTQKLLQHYEISKPLRSFHAGNRQRRLGELQALLRGGKSVAAVSDAGMPGIADPGSELVRSARGIGSSVEVLPGPNAALSALVLSGFDVSRFCFEGFPPRKAAARKKYLQSLAGGSAAVVWYEAPSRIHALLRDIDTVLGGRPLFVLREYTKRFEQQCCGSAATIVAQLAQPALGEFVVVLAPDREPQSAAPEAFSRASAALQLLLREDAGLKLAVDAVRSATGLPRNELYAEAQRLNALAAGAGAKEASSGGDANKNARC